MLQHVVLFRWRDDMPAGAVEAVRAGLSALPDAIPEIRSYRVGSDAGLGADNWDFAVVATFASVEDWQVYRDHPRHQAVIAEYIRPWVAERSAVQSDVPEP